MAAFPLVALQTKLPEQTDYLTQMGKVAALKTILQNQQYQKQLQPIELQKQQQDLQTSQLGYQKSQMELESERELMGITASVFGGQKDDESTTAAAPDTTQQTPPPSPNQIPITPPAPAAPPTAPLSTLAPPPDGSAPPPGPPLPPPGPPPGTAPLAPDNAPPPPSAQPAGQPAAPVQKTLPASSGNFLDKFQEVVTQAQRSGKVLPGTILEMAGKVLTMQDTFAKMTETQQKTVLAQAQEAGELAYGLTSADPAKQAQIWTQDQQAIALMGPKAAALRYGAGVAGYIANNPYPGPQAIAEHLGKLQSTNDMLKDQHAQLENKKIAPFEQDDLDQANASLQAAWTANTGKPMPGVLFLKPGDGQQAFDNHMEMMKSVFGGAQVKARTAGAEAWARVGPAVSEEKQKLEMRQKMLPDPVAGVAPNLVPKAISEADKYGHEYVTAQAAAQEMQSMIDMMRSGNKVAYEYSPVTGVLAINLGNQTKRINMSEIKSYKGSGSSWDNIDGWFGKKLKGEGIPDNIVNDMEQLHQQLGNNAADTYRHSLEITNGNYGSKFQPVQLSPNTAPVAPNANTAPVAPNANKPAASATPPVQPAPAGMVSVQIPGQKPGWVSRSQVEQFKRKYPNATVSQ